ncbi:hypothetical protein BGZ52_012562, partial [Haplosporangium bisporale]
MADKMELEQLEAPVAPSVPEIVSEKRPASATTSTTEVPSVKDVEKVVDTMPSGKADKAKKSKDKKKKKAGDAGSTSDEEEVPTEKKAVSYFTLYRFATKKDWMYIIIATLASIISGVGQPMVALLMGNIIQDLQNPDPNEVSKAITKDVVLFTVIGAAMFAVAYTQ